jgi:hypothetical protein
VRDRGLPCRGKDSEARLKGRVRRLDGKESCSYVGLQPTSRLPIPPATYEANSSVSLREPVFTLVIGMELDILIVVYIRLREKRVGLTAAHKDLVRAILVSQLRSITLPRLELDSDLLLVEQVGALEDDAEAALADLLADAVVDTHDVARRAAGSHCCVYRAIQRGMGVGIGGSAFRGRSRGVSMGNRP